MWRRAGDNRESLRDPRLRHPPFLCAHLLSPSTPFSLCSYYKGIRQMVQVSDQDMNTHLAEISRVRTTELLKSEGVLLLLLSRARKYGSADATARGAEGS